jgi:hypothetical protein
MAINFGAPLPSPYKPTATVTGNIPLVNRSGNTLNYLGTALPSTATYLPPPRNQAPSLVSTPPPFVPPTLPPVVRPPKLDFAAVQAQARKDAENAVNPYYTKRLNDFLAQQKAQREARQAEADTSIENLGDTLAETLKSNEIEQKRTEENVGQNIADITQAEDQFQTDAGQAFDANRLATARTAGGEGGLAAQEDEAAIAQRNTVEGRQAEQVKQQRQQQQLFKTRTFEDLGRSGELATKAKVKGEKAVKFDLDNFIKMQGFEEESTKGELEAQRLERVTQEAGNQAKLAYTRYLAGIADPAQLAAAAATYGGVF